MIGIYKNVRQALIRLGALHSLIFFVSILFIECQHPQDTGITIRWNNKRATGISIPRQIVQSTPTDSLTQLLTVRLAGKETTILGNYQLVDDAIIFEPLIPFTRGRNYTVWVRNNRLGEITVPELAAGDNPTLLAIYPSQDSLPDNLLKIYLYFSRPMREGQSQKYVRLVKNNTDTLPGVFLDLQPELWNADRTLLTLWLDPGRIKRDLIPNKLLGAPLQVGSHYQLVVSAAWPDEQGALLNKTTKKPFLTVQRDSLSPLPAHWTLRQPQAGSAQPLELDFGEALDHTLLTETLHIINQNGTAVSGKWQIKNEEKQGSFKPDEPWKPGQYTLKIEARLEDLAGNNLNRPFDRDLTRKTSAVTSQPFIKLFFKIR